MVNHLPATLWVAKLVVMGELALALAWVLAFAMVDVGLSGRDRRDDRPG